MNVIAYEARKIGDLLLPGNWRKVLEDPELERKASTIQRFGVLQDPMVRESDNRLIFGAHRLAACSKLGIESVTCKIVEATDEEIETIRDVENYERFHNEKQRATRLVALVNRLAEMDPEPPKVPRSKGGKTPKGRAREKVAKEAGVRAETIRMQEYRANKKNPPPPPEKPVPTIDTMGMELSDEFVIQLADLTAGLKRAAQFAAQAKGELTKIRNAKLPFNEARFNTITATLEDAGSALGALVPASLCPFCKGVEGVEEQCSGCNKSGYVTKDQLANVPPGFLDLDKPVVLVGGKKVKLDDVLPSVPETFVELDEIAVPEPKQEGLW